jgi:ferredoxin-NADP reductase
MQGPIERQLITAHVRRSILLSERTKHLELELAGSEPFHFLPGQFISVREPKPEGKHITRAYSLASAPRPDKTLELCLDRIDTGFMSNHLCDLAIGDEVHFHGPHGAFTLRPEQLDSVFVATGTGIAPIRSMIEWLFADASRNESREFWLVYGTRHAEDIYYREEFESIAARFPNFHYEITLSRPLETWTGHSGYVQDRVREIAGTRKDMHAYVCGLNEMVSSVRKLLKEELGWERKHVIYERYD